MPLPRKHKNLVIELRSVSEDQIMEKGWVEEFCRIIKTERESTFSEGWEKIGGDNLTSDERMMFLSLLKHFTTDVAL